MSGSMSSAVSGSEGWGAVGLKIGLEKSVMAVLRNWSLASSTASGREIPKRLMLSVTISSNVYCCNWRDPIVVSFEDVR